MQLSPNRFLPQNIPFSFCYFHSHAKEVEGAGVIFTTFPTADVKLLVALVS